RSQIHLVGNMEQVLRRAEVAGQSAVVGKRGIGRLAEIGGNEDGLQSNHGSSPDRSPMGPPLIRRARPVPRGGCEISLKDGRLWSLRAGPAGPPAALRRESREALGDDRENDGRA